MLTGSCTLSLHLRLLETMSNQKKHARIHTFLRYRTVSRRADDQHAYVRNNSESGHVTCLSLEHDQLTLIMNALEQAFDRLRIVGIAERQIHDRGATPVAADRPPDGV